MGYEIKIDPSGKKMWLRDGVLHRDDGPAVEKANGTKEWYVAGKLHRVNGPAVECLNGNKYWNINGYLHREDGPAIEWANGEVYWYLYGTSLTKEDWLEKIPEESKEKILFNSNFILK